MLTEAAFFISAAAGIYHHAVYPFLLQKFSAGEAAPAPKIPDTDELPTLAIIVPAHNEEAFIARKIENLASLDYPREKLFIVIACDGCTDRTVEIAKAAAARAGNLAIAIAIQENNAGKVATLNVQIALCLTDIVALSDVSACLPKDALLRTAAQFADRAVGVVCGTYRLPAASGAGERLYWDYQCRIKAAEAALDAPFGAHGAFYAFRRKVWKPLPADTINDDVILPMLIVAAGYRAVYDRYIIATEAELSTPAQEFRRRVRIGAGNLQQAIRLRALANFERPGLAFVFLSGKALRAVMPFFGALAALSVLILAVQGSPAFQALALLGLIGAVLCALPYSALPPALQPLSTLGRGYAAGFIGASAYLLRGQRQPWRRAIIDEAEGHRHYIPISVERSKRLFDILCALCALLVLCVLYVPLAIAIKLSSRGPVFYRQMRVGRITPRFTELFWLIKFRTMRQDAEVKSGPVWASDNDPRITKLGRFMRKTRLDEIPQCINVLRGEMSIVGPRPERPSFFHRLEREIPFYIERTYGLRPGITGLAQINQAYDQNIEDVRNKVLYDHTYALRLSRWRDWLISDLGIIFRTAAVVVTGRGAK
jgi:lipopolysaccharide/colanic/teichoic acid biosynthesis glycosyltransferase